MIIVRIILSAALLFMVYRETGPWTTAAVGLLGTASELSARTLKKLLEALR